MKTILLAALLLIAVACSENETVQMGCQTGILKGTTTRVTIRCCTQEEHFAGDNVANGGTKLFTYYSNVQWQPIDDCKNCQ